MSHASVAERPYVVNRLTVATRLSPDELRRRYEEAVPVVPRECIEELVKRDAPWSEMIELVSRAAPHGFLLYHTLELGVMRLAGHRSGGAAYLMGNHTIAERMYRHDPAVMLHAPLRTLIWEAPDGTARFTVDQPSSHFASYGDPEIAAVGVELDQKLGSLLDHLHIDVPEALRNTRPRPSVRERWAESFSDSTGARFAAIVAPDASLEGSIFAQPIEGRDEVWTALRASAGIYDAITFTAETSSAERTCLEWTAQALGLELAGVTMLTLDDGGLVTNVALHHRPLGAVLAFSRELRNRLAGLIDPTHFVSRIPE